MSHLKKQDKEETIYYSVFNPMNNITSTGSISNGLQVETGQPVLFTSEDKNKAYDMAYSEWSEDEYGEVSGTQREYIFTVYKEDELEDLEQVLSVINSVDGFNIRSVNRPDSTDKLLIFSEYAFSQLPENVQGQLQAAKDSKAGKRIEKADV